MKSLRRRIHQNSMFYCLMIPAFIIVLVFSYMPMGGALLAFKKYAFNVKSSLDAIPILRFFGQMANMDDVGLMWFERLWSKPDFWASFRNTLIISFGRLLIEFPMPILLALMLNEVRGKRTKRLYQTIYTFPHFLSWVLVCSMMQMLLKSDGTINNIITVTGGAPVKFLSSPELFRPMLYLSSIWKEVGWSSIIYLASIAGIDPTLYEASAIDGCSRWKQSLYITLPSIKSTIVILLILQCGYIMNGGFDQVFNLYSDLTLSTGDIIDTYIYRYTFQKGQNMSLSVAAGLFKSVCNFILLIMANNIAKMLGQDNLI